MPDAATLAKLREKRSALDAEIRDLDGRGSRKLSVEEKVRRGTYRADRDGPLGDSEAFGGIPPKPDPRPKGKCKGWRRKYIHTKSDQAAADAGCWCDEQLGDHVIDFFHKYLRHSKGRWAGQPFELAPWQQKIIRTLFGWVRPNGRRRFRRAYIEVPKKNGKSTLASGIGLYLLLADGEPGAEVYSVAADREQANIVHREAMNMVEASDELSAIVDVRRSHYNIIYGQTKSHYRSLSGTGRVKEGHNASGLIFDELHVWPNRDVWDRMIYSGRTRTQPLMFVITTAGDDMESICREQHDYARQIERGDVLDQRVFSYIRAADPEAEIGDRAIWRKANPSLGITFDEDELAHDLGEAKKSLAALASWKRYSLNIWQTGTNPWLSMDRWAACGDEFPVPILHGRDCWLGLDLAKTSDMTAAVLVFRDDEEYRVLPYFWLPEDAARDKRKIVPYLQWHEAGVLELTEGNVCDYTFVRQRIVELSQRFNLHKLLYDPYNAEHLVQQLVEEDGLQAEAFKQTIDNYAEPTAEFERLVASGKLRHPNNPILNWQAGHVQVRTDISGNKRPVKPKENDVRKVDGIVAAIMGLAGALKGDVSPTGCFFVS